MKEIWQEYRKFKKTGRYYCKGDVIYISNKGRVKLNDRILKIGDGLYVVGGDIKIVGVGTECMYRWIYKTFKGKIEKGNQIHHIDGNHLNNDIRNLIQLSNSEHTKTHWRKKSVLKDNLQKCRTKIKRLNNKKDDYIKKFESVCYERTCEDRLQNIDDTITKRLQEIEYYKNKRAEKVRQRRLAKLSNNIA